MPEEIKTEVLTPQPQPNETSGVKGYASDLENALKEKDAKFTAKEEEYKAEINKLTKMLVNGQLIEDPEQKVVWDEEQLKAARLQFVTNEDSPDNITFAKRALELRQQCIDRGEQDPFLSPNPNHAITDEEVATAEKVAKILQECVDGANGNNDVFTSLLQSRMVGK